MRSIWIHLLALVITMTSVVMEVPVIDFNLDQMASLQTIPSWETDSLRNPTEKIGERNHIIAEDFMPIVLIAEAQDFSYEFNHYLPLYRLYREKDFFLLI